MGVITNVEFCPYIQLKQRGRRMENKEVAHKGGETMGGEEKKEGQFARV